MTEKNKMPLADEQAFIVKGVVLNNTFDGSAPADGGKVADTASESVEEILDLAVDRDEPYPAGLPERGGSTAEPAEPYLRDDVYLKTRDGRMETSTLALMSGKLPSVPRHTPKPVGDPGGLAAVLANRVTSGCIQVALGQTRLSTFCMANPTRVAPIRIEQRAHEHRMMGQALPCQARIGADGFIEILTRQLDFLAAHHRAQRGEAEVTLTVDISELGDASAYQVAYADAAGSLPVAPIDFARWAIKAIEGPFRTQRALASALGLDESNVTRLLHVAKAVDLLGRVIVDEANVSRNQADRFISLCADKAAKAEIRSFVSQMKPATAAKIFGAIFDKFDPRRLADRYGIDVMGDGDTILGSVRANAAGTVLITLDQAAGDVEVPTLIAFIETALTRLRADV